MRSLLCHVRPGRFLLLAVHVLIGVWNLPLMPIGGTTMRRRRKRRGLEVDEAFYIANAERMAGRDNLDLRVDPPPDLAIEIDVTHGSLDRLAIYAALGVLEVWRLAGGILTFHVLGDDGRYHAAERSRSFPFL